MRRHSRSETVGKNLEHVEKRSEKSSGSPTKETVRKRSSFVKEYLVDYAANSNLHGLKYIGEKERTFMEKIFWLLMFTCCVVLCAGLIRKVWIKWNESPVIVSFAENPTPVWQIPYPAVTVCFETKAMQSTFNFTKYFHMYKNETTLNSMTDNELNLFEDVSLVCDDHLAPQNGRDTSDGAETVRNLIEVSPNMSDVFFGCRWKDVAMEHCDELFSSILTEEGQCYTFNMLHPQDLFRLENLHQEYSYLSHKDMNKSWSLESGYEEGTPLETYPHRGLGYGVKAGLRFLLKAREIDLDYLCKGPVQGFKILLHNPAELPRLSQQYFRLPFSQEVVVAVKPKMMTTSDGLKPYDPDRRKCYFPNERYLQYFKVYTQANCEMECLTNFTFERCRCVHFGMPHGPNMPVCNAGSVECMKAAQMELVTAEAQTGLEEETNDGTVDSALQVAAKCKCLPACTSIEYEAETSQADYDWNALNEAFMTPTSDDEKDLRIQRSIMNLNKTSDTVQSVFMSENIICSMLYARVMIFFKEAQFITSRRSELYGQTDFLANCGGLLGLFMGFSILSFVEILYFLTLRLLCNLYRRRTANKKSSGLFPKEDQDVSSPKPSKMYIE